MVDITTPDLLPGLSGNIVKKRLVDMGDGTFAEMTVTTLAASANAVGTVNLGSLNGAATAANQALGNAALSTLTAPFTAATSVALTALGAGWPWAVLKHWPRVLPMMSCRVGSSST